MRIAGAAAIAATVVLLAAGPAPAAGLAVGDRAPMPQAKEVIGLSSFSPKDAEGKVVLYEIFRTW